MSAGVRSTAASDATWTAGLPRRLDAIVAGIDAWITARRRAVDDREKLASMSDRELRDIGVERSAIDAAASGAWMRERPL